MSYLQTLKADAIKVWHSHQVLPSICAAQASLESGWGTSRLAKEFNNHFGIKASADWTGRKVTMLTGEHVNGGRIEIYADFRAYDTIYDSIADYAAFFTNTPWRTENYKHVVGETDYKKAANALRAAGYATDPQYPTKLIKIIEDNNLQAWDREALSSSAGSAPSTQATATKYDSSKSSNATAITTSGWNQTEVDRFLMNAVDPHYINGAYINRFLTAYYPGSPLIGEGDTIKSMADYYGISVGAAMGVWAKETSFGREHPGLVDHNYGRIKWTSGSEYPSVTHDGVQWNKYPSKKAGIAAWFHLLRYNYIELGYHRYDSFLNRYSPTGESVQATFKSLMWGALKAFGYDTSITNTKYNHSSPNDNTSTVTPPPSIGGGTVTTTPKPINKVVGGQLTSAVEKFARENGASWIGDSLMVGTEPHAKKLSPGSNFDGLGSRQITHATPSLNATTVLKNMINAGTLKNIIIFVIGTNRGVTRAEIDAVMTLIGSERKIIFVSTASEVNHAAGVAGEYYGASERYQNAFYADWHQEGRAKREVYYTPDGAGGKRIHMTSEGYKAHADYLTAAWYEVATADYTQDVAVAAPVVHYDIKDFELNVDGIITYYENTKPVTGADGKVTFIAEEKTHDTGIKGFYSPKGDKYVYYPESNNRWSHGGEAGTPTWIDTIYTNDKTSSAIELIEGAIQDLIEKSEPASQYTISLLDVNQDLSIGDYGVFIDHKYNPPLYIEARILSISTSLTDQTANTVVIGNVTELVQKENPDITALKAELQNNRSEIKKEMQSQNPITATLLSSNGYILGDAHKETQLILKLFQGTKDVTDQYNTFEWERTSSDSASDEQFNKLLEVEKSNTIKVYNRDIMNNQSVFIGRAYSNSGGLMKQAEVKLSFSDTAIWSGSDIEPTDAVDGSTWTKPDGTQWILIDGVWEERVDQAQIFSVRGEVEGAIAGAEQAKADAAKAYDDAIAEAERLVTESDTIWQGKMDDYDEQVALIDASATSAQAKAEQALTEAGISTDLAQTAKDLADTAKTNAQTALNNASVAVSDASTALTEAGQAISSANTAKTNAQTAIDDAQSALTTAGNAKTTADALTITVNDLEGEVELKASQTEVDGINGTVSTHTTTLGQHATQIASKAESELVNTIKGTVDTHTTEISQNATDIASKASSSSVNTLTGRVSTAETTISQNATAIESKASQTEVDTVKGTVSTHTTTLGQHATQINARLTSTEVNSLVDGKGLAQVTYVDNQITATSDSFGVEMTRVEGKIDGLEIGVTNLIKDSENLSNPMSPFGGATSTVVPINMTEEWGFSEAYDVHLQGGTSTIKGVWGTSGNTTEPMVLGQQYTHSFWIKNLSSSNSLQISTNGLEPNKTVTVAPGESIRYQHTGVRRQEYDWYQTHFRSMTAGSNIRFAIGRFKLEKGTRATDWTPAPEDTMMENDFTVFKNSYQSTVNSINSELSKTAKTTDLNGMVTETTLATKNFVTAGTMNTTLSNYAQKNGVPTNTQFNTLKNSYDSMVQTIGTNGSNIAQMVMTDSLFSTTVRDSVEVGGRNFILNSDILVTKAFPLNDEMISFLNDSDQVTVSVYVEVENAQPSGNNRIGYELGVRFEDNSISTISVWLNPGQGENFKGRIANTVDISNWKKVTALRHNLTIAQTGYDRMLVGRPKLEKGNVATDWTPAPEDKAEQSQVTQLAGSWALTLKSGGDIKTQINATTDGIRLQSKLIHLSGDTLIDDATIKSAKIENLNANKIVGNTADFNTIRTGVLTADVVTSAHIKASEALIDNIFGDTAYINKLTSKTAFINSIKAIDISADKISGGSITGSTFSTTASADNFTIELSNGNMEFKRAIFTMGTMNLTKDANTLQPNGFAITQRPGYMFNIASVYNDGSTTSSPVLQIPVDSHGASKKLYIYAQGELRIDSDSFDLNPTVATFNVPLVLMSGLKASHTYNSTPINDTGNLMYAVDKDVNGAMFHRLSVRTKSGSWVNSRFEFYEDGRLARVVNGVRTFY